MRILLVIERLERGGAARAFLQQARLLSSQGHTVAVVTLQHHLSSITLGGLQHYPLFGDFLAGYRMLGLPAGLTDNRFVYRLSWNMTPSMVPGALTRVIKQFRPDVVHFHAVQEFLHPAVLQAPFTAGIPAVLTLHDTAWVCPVRTLLKGGTALCDAQCSLEDKPGSACFREGCIPSPLGRHFNVADFRERLRQITVPKHIQHLVTPSKALADLVVGTGRVPAQHVSVVPSLTLGTTTPEAVDVSQPMPQTYFLAVGQLHAHKGFAELIEAFSYLPHIPLKLVGDGPQRSELARLMRQRRANHIEMTGWLEGRALWQAYRHAYALVVPSLWFESLGLVVQEAFRFGKPVIAADVGGLPEMVKPSVSGMLFPRADFYALGVAVEHLWNNPMVATRLGQGGQQVLASSFTPEVQYPMLLSVYQSLVSAGGAAVGST